MPLFIIKQFPMGPTMPRPRTCKQKTSITQTYWFVSLEGIRDPEFLETSYQLWMIGQPVISVPHQCMDQQYSLVLQVTALASYCTLLLLYRQGNLGLRKRWQKADHAFSSKQYYRMYQNGTELVANITILKTYQWLV